MTLLILPSAMLGIVLKNLEPKSLFAISLTCMMLSELTLALVQGLIVPRFLSNVS